VKVERRRKRFLPALTLIAVVLVLLVITAVTTQRHLDRSQMSMERSLTRVGRALIIGLEAGTRAGLRRHSWQRQALQHLVEEMGRDKAIKSIVIFNRRGRVLAHSNPRYNDHILQVKDARFNKPRDFFVQAPQGLARSFADQVFYVGRPFRPLFIFRRRRRMHGGMMPPPPPGVRFDRDVGPLGSPLYCLVGLSTAPYREARSADIRHALLMGGILFVVGLAVLYFVFILQSSRLVERTLRELETYTQLVVDNVPEGLITTDQAGRIVSTNARAEAMLDPEGRGLVGLPLSQVFGDSAGFVDQVLGSGQVVAEVETECRGPAGRDLPVSVSAAPLLGADGQRLGAVFALRDLTEMAKLREDLSRSKRLAALGELAAGVAHEIRNPLSAIRGLVLYLAKKFPSDSAEAEYAGVVVSEVDRMGRVIGGLLDFARPKAPEFARADLSKIIRHALTLIEDEARAARVEVDFQMDEGLPPVRVDRDQMTQVLLNLLVNALEAMPEGGRLQVNVHRETDQAEIRVSDTGPGISSENLSRLFDPFHTTKKKGSGLGLAIAQRIVENHGGTIRVDSRAGLGTTFLVRLPLEGPGPDPGKAGEGD
jgi:two-component system sensor histidine kinase HydH